MIDTRLKNISWTVEENYSSQYNYRLFSAKNKYSAALRGYLHRIYDFDLIEDFFAGFIYAMSNSEDLIAIAEIIMENFVFDSIVDERPGIIDYRKDYIKEFSEGQRVLKKDLKTELKSAFYDFKAGKIPKINQILRDMLDDILLFDSNDSYEYIEYLKKIYKKYFKIEKNFSTEKSKKYESFVKDKIKESEDRKKSREDIIYDDSTLEKFNIESAEFTIELDIDTQDLMKDELKSNSSTDSNIYGIIKKFYGKEQIPRHEIMKMERSISTGIHKDINIFFSSGIYDNEEGFFAKRIKQNTEENIDFYDQNFLNFERGIRKLSTTIKTYLLQESEDYEIRSNTGKLIPNQIWKAKYLDDNRIFKKVQKSDSKEIYVDILLDSSASQSERKSSIAAQTYMITSALTRLNIKTRVIGFNNLYNYLIIKKFRDYNDSEIKNSEIMKYTPSGSNRDGMAIKLMRYLIKQNPDQRKFLIVLSDGKPNDELNLGIVGSYKLKGKSYTDSIAIKDSAKEILLTKLKGINTLGVFTGNEDDIQKVKTIYGNDFAYITDIDRFHEIVGIFLKSFSNKID
ncbi:MAG: hypothetical protein Q4P34_07770 [Tissierellia bacterium]|nr:hypothetical protein [Tissierellia bacterium]